MNIHAQIASATFGFVKAPSSERTSCSRMMTWITGLDYSQVRRNPVNSNIMQ